MQVSSYNNVVNSESLKKLIEAAENIVSVDENQKLNWWFDFKNEPKNVIETYISECCKKLNLQDYIGAEWWIRRVKEQKFHTDLDVSSVNKKSLYRVADVSTILYLSNFGGQTIITNCYQDTDCEDELELLPSIPSVFYHSFPKEGKLVVFKKPYVHGVVPGTDPNLKRLTLMFNLWKNEKPLYPSCREYDLPYEIKNHKVVMNNLEDMSVINGNYIGNYYAYMCNYPKKVTMKMCGQYTNGESVIIQ